VGLAATAAGAAAGCTSAEEEACVSNEMFFAEQVWSKVLSVRCLACHNPQGVAAAKTDFVLKNSTEAGFLRSNMEIFQKIATTEQNGTSLVLLKPTQQTAHEGGLVIQEGSEEYNIISEMVQRYKEPAECETDTAAFFAGVQLASAPETLRMAALELLGRLPTAEEEKAVTEGGMAALDVVVDQYMQDEAFYIRLKEIYGDVFLTDRYLNNEGLDLLTTEDYDPRWYEALPFDAALIEKHGAESWDDLMQRFESWTIRGVAKEPLELVAHVVRQEKPFTEIVTAPYFMVNPYSAKAYGVYDAVFENDADPNEFVEAYRGPDFPHAGVLTSSMWLSRFPTTPTNRNRHRARMIYQFFLGTDVLKLAERALDTSSVADFNPTVNNQNCVACHANIDPIAGTLQKFNEIGQYEVDFAWYEEMWAPGFGKEKLPSELFPRGTQWLGDKLAKDSRFALAAVYNVMTGLTGHKPLQAPAIGEENYDAKFHAYLAQYYLLDAIAQDFIASGYNLKEVVRLIIKSPYFRARNYGGEITPQRELDLQQLTSTRFLPPEQLHRKIWAITGYPWREGRYGGDFLLRSDRYRMLYGGIDFTAVVARIKDPNGIMANVADRMANEMSCVAVPRDFSLPEGERLLFPYVDPTYEPKDANGFDVQPVIQAIKQNIQYLHRRVLGENLAIDDPEVERTYKLFLEIWQEGQDGMALPEEDPARISTQLQGECQVHDDYWTQEAFPEDSESHVDDDSNYTIRAWMGVMTYLLSDFRFLYQ
jgi:mono/diheme cytochrome c family protein